MTMMVPNTIESATSRLGFFTSAAVKPILFQASAENNDPTCATANASSNPYHPFANGNRGKRMVRIAAGVGGGAGRIVVFRRCLEQYRFHGGGSEKSQARRGAFDGVRDRHCHYALLPGEPCLSLRLALGADSVSAGRSGGHSGAVGDFWRQRRGDNGHCDHHFDLWLQQWLDSRRFARGVRDGQGRPVLQGYWQTERERGAGH